ncbi:MAG: hypothetical protein V4751_12005 [Pseudomonadota bacterium]
MHINVTLPFFRSMLLLVALALLAGCSEQPTGSNASANPSASTSPEHSAYDTSLNIRDFMNLILDPTADVLWDSAGWVDSRESGYEELYPTTDEQWDYVRRNAALIIEIGNMLALPGRAVDNDAWMTYAKGLSQAGTIAMEAAAVQNKEDFFQAGAQLYSVCTACHQAYNPEITSKFATN